MLEAVKSGTIAGQEEEIGHRQAMRQNFGRLKSRPPPSSINPGIGAPRAEQENSAAQNAPHHGWFFLSGPEAFNLTNEFVVFPGTARWGLGVG
jgi:hypothetical protein